MNGSAPSGIDQAAKPIERRFRLYFLGLAELMMLLNLPSVLGRVSHVALEDRGALPADAVALSATFDPVRNGFAVLVWSESFGVVPDGAEIMWNRPLWQVTWRVEPAGEQEWRLEREGD